MLYQKSLAILVAFLFSASLIAQKLPVSRTIQAAYDRGTRSPDGKPGKNYWQNAADYRIQIDFNPVTREISGTVDIDYYNNSPDTLRQVWFKLFPNLYKAGAMRERLLSPDDIGKGLTIDSFFIAGNSLAKQQLRIDGTNLIVRHKADPGSRTSFRIRYHFILNEGSHVRTGQVAPGAHFVAYFFPRITVYDDIDGWNRYQYNGNFEFYNDFSNFDVRIRVPQHYVVWATGDLQNCSEVFQKPYCDRIALAERSDSIMDVIGQQDDKQQITAANAFNTWHYKASHVTDFAFATSDHYIWQSSSVMVDPMTGRRTRVDAVFDPKHHDYFWVAPDARETVRHMSYSFPKWPFPYSHVTVFDGLDQMEYPMMVNDNPVATRFEELTLTAHEVFHMMFPFYVGINETKYAWMDEGWATIGEWLIASLVDSTIINDYGVQPTEMHMNTEKDLPIVTISAETDDAYYTNSYPEPAMGYLYVRDLLGDSLFTKALHFYIEQWQGKHPMPFDFFNCINTASGRDLNWFWHRWFFETGFADLAISKVKKRSRFYEVTITSVGNLPVPVDLKIEFEDNSIEKVHRDISVWQKGNNSVKIKIPTRKKIKSMELGSTWVPDTNKADNLYQGE